MSLSNLTNHDDDERTRSSLPSILFSGVIFTFRRFHVIPSARQLLLDGCEIDIGGRAFDLLVILLEARGTIVDKTRIFQHVWPSTTVDESNLRFQMGVLRKALGDDRDVIKTIAGRGYILAEDLPSGGATVLAAQAGYVGGLPAVKRHTATPRFFDESSNLSRPTQHELDIVDSDELQLASDMVRVLERENNQLRKVIADLTNCHLFLGTGFRPPQQTSL